MEVAHIDAFRRDPKRFWSFYRPRFAAPRRQAAQRRPRRARRARAPRAARRGDHPEHRPPAPQGGHGAGDRGPRLDRDLELHELRRELPARGGRRAVRRRRRRRLRLLHGQGEARRRAVRRAAARGGDRARPSELAAGADLLLCVGSSLEVYPVAGLPELTLVGGGARRDRHPGPDAVRRPRRRSSSTATSSPSSTRCSRRSRR